MSGLQLEKEAAPPRLKGSAAPLDDSCGPRTEATNSPKPEAAQESGAYYAPGFPEQVAAAALELMNARDRLVSAWLAWRDTPLGAESSPECEGEIIAAILEAAAEDADGQ